ncbi:MAG: DUF29 family protein [Pseudanabaena sp. M135S2SP2A07QC]|nr:DUF29 family protein [Pseudanabaena sp. M051S1SP2A07QC]MCA6527821.1 DUF29 family protein [Pseudanabaena sp. M179S2SP2A07QC]MCA6529652.1 DUF29 family protein [Pseudanabaena sp. M125S2SP2A07QC]MCA6536795.1 DUF29 family protein [Pseudanabaena sp. M176S2SP2A07QC]MCA6538506.1 DUF29 family protein [Pseudanabaena sp. M037S2SP2A07QC]MCA6544510.1 DUF29 family protein [Pseudanabaena sp. M074S1SP2A07QC]MCA6549442.1 DUF29 family protein [Pseudanabaena sp. M152S2SP2A07QC]MCA6552820.1 DUF29 family prot
MFNTDYALWVLETGKQLQARDFEAIDLDNLQRFALKPKPIQTLKALLSNAFRVCVVDSSTIFMSL